MKSQKFLFDDTFAFEDLRFAHKIEIKKNKFRYIYFDIKCQVTMFRITPFSNTDKEFD